MDESFFLGLILVMTVIAVICFSYASLSETKAIEGFQKYEEILREEAENKVEKNLWKVPNIKNNPKCPVQIIAIILSSMHPDEPQNSLYTYCFIHFKNASKRIIKAIKYEIICFDAFGEPVSEPPANIVKALIQNQQVEPGESFGHIEYQADYLKNDKLPFTTVGLVEIYITNILFSDGTRWQQLDEKD